MYDETNLLCLLQFSGHILAQISRNVFIFIRTISKRITLVQTVSQFVDYRKLFNCNSIPYYFYHEI